MSSRVPGLLLCCITASQAQNLVLDSVLHPQATRVGKQQVPTTISVSPLSEIKGLVRTTDGALWIGTGRGIIRQYAGKYQYFAGQRYLPHDEVIAMTADGPAGVLVHTKAGSSRIQMVSLTLEQKAAQFEDRVQKRHNRHGMVADSHLKTPGDLSTNQMFSSDNDGLWTAMYGAAECYRYAATKSPEALALAKRSVEALLFLEKVTGRPGFPARSYIKKGEPKPSDGVWYKTPDNEIEWKADTSSDEIVGHFYLFSIAYDLLPDPELKKRIAETARRIMDHILANGYYLIDVTGKPTRWGKWSPAYFESKDGKSDAPLNAVELLGFLKATRHFTGDAKYDAEYRKAAIDLGYAKMTARYAELMEELNYSDEELAMLSFYTLFRYEKDPALLATYRQGLDQWWKNIQRENNPLWMLIYRYCNPASKLDMKPAVQTLGEIPLDLIQWGVQNSHRADVKMSSTIDRFGRKEAETLLPAYERPVMKWNGNPFIVDVARNGSSEDDGGFYLLPYWMGRSLNFWRER